MDTVIKWSAPYPQYECESVREYNRKHYGNAWAIVGMVWQGCTYCLDCVGEWPTYEHDLVDSPSPVFRSDDYERMTCDNCTNYLHWKWV